MSDTTTVLLAATVMGRSKTVTIDVDAIHEKYGIAPRQLIEVKSLMGDTSDNIPGVKGIGEKTALSLVQTFGSLEACTPTSTTSASSPSSGSTSWRTSPWPS